MTELSLRPYSAADAGRWDAFARDSKNATFLLQRGYMDYHADRFTDHSLIITDETDRWLAVMPANESGHTLASHGGLTYGGLVFSHSTSATAALPILSAVCQYLRSHAFTTLIYKAIPYIYHRQPSDDDLYALFRLGASLTVRNLSTAINLADPIPSSRLGKRALKRQRRFNIEVNEIDSCTPFWDIVIEDRRVRHNVKPVHTAAELDYLKSRCPDNIRFYTATREGETLGGAVIYLDRGVIHLQYAACTPRGKEMYATDVIYHDLIYRRLTGNRYFDFGISNENDGLYLNEGMVLHKEEFGGRAVAYDIYTLTL